MSGMSFFGQAMRAIHRHRKHTEKAAGPAPHIPRNHHEQYEGWQVEIQEKKIGVTVPRMRYYAAIWRRRTNTREYLSGFATRQAALDAVHQRIQELNTQATSPPRNSQKVCGPLRRNS